MRKLLIFALLAFVACKETEEPLTQKAIEGDWKAVYFYQEFYPPNGDVIKPMKTNIGSGFGVHRFEKNDYILFDYVQSKEEIYTDIPYSTDKDSVLIFDRSSIITNPDGTLNVSVLAGVKIDNSRGPLYYEVTSDTLFVYNRFTIQEEVDLYGENYTDVLTVRGTKFSRIQ